MQARCNRGSGRPHRRFLSSVAFCAILGISASGWAQLASDAPTPNRPLDGPLTPAQAIRSFQVAPGLRVELVAAEPMVESPVAMVFDERGRLFVAENRGYPTGPGLGQPPVGRIVMLEDDD